jgi:hypothetical protein
VLSRRRRPPKAALLWDVKHGEHAQFLADVAEDWTDPVSAEAAQSTLDERPDLNAEQALLLRWFGVLSRARPQSMGDVPCAIPMSELEAFYRLHALRGVVTPEDFVGWMMELDRALIEFYMERVKKKKPARDARDNVRS